MYCNYCRASNPDDSSYCARCGRALVPTVPSGATPDSLSLASTELGLAPGTRLLNRYRITRELGAGGMGTVYQAYDEKLEMPVAIKVLRDVLSRDPGSVKRLIAEARHSMILSHANVVRVHNFEDGEISKFLVMEYVEGETLGHRLAREAKLSEEDTRKIAIEVCKGLEHAHAKNVIHRDLKPGNVLLGKDGSVKLADFGIARICRDSMSRLTSQQSSGTLLYMSPEQLIGKSNEASDVYSLGIMLYEMLSGDPPFNSGDIPYQIREVTPGALPQVSQEMNAIIMRCLEKKSEKRFSSVRDLREELEGKAQAKRLEEQRKAEELQRRVEREQKESAEKQRLEEMRRQEEKRADEGRLQQIERLLAQGQDAMDVADYARALSKWEEAQKLSPSDASIAQAISLARKRLAESIEKQREQNEQRRCLEEQKHSEDLKMEPRVTPPRRRISKSRLRWIAASLGFVTLVILGIAWWDEYGPRPETTVTVSPPPNTPPGRDTVGGGYNGGGETIKGGSDAIKGSGITTGKSSKTFEGSGGTTKGAGASESFFPPPGMRSWSDSEGLVVVPYPNSWQVDYQSIARIQQVAPWYSFAAVEVVTHTSVEVYIMRGVTSVQGVLRNMEIASYPLGLTLSLGQPQSSYVGTVPATAVPFTMTGVAGVVTGWVYITQVGSGSVCIAVSAPPPIYNAAVPSFQRVLSQTQISH